jgi:hypothetical protein
MMRAQTLRKLRQWHRYLGLFFTPAILLFSVSGGMQTYRLQETSGYGGTPPSWIMWLASIHKDQRLPRGSAAPAQKSALSEHPTTAKASPRRSTTMLKAFVALLAAGLALSALLGATIAINTKTSRGFSLLMLALGAIVPLVVLYV